MGANADIAKLDILHRQFGKTKLVVFNEHTLGYIIPENAKEVYVLHESILKGATFRLNPVSSLINKNDTVRLATKEDFNEYRVSFEGYENNPNYQYKY
jgi:hypothetical protein